MYTKSTIMNRTLWRWNLMRQRGVILGVRKDHMGDPSVDLRDLAEAIREREVVRDPNDKSWHFVTTRQEGNYPFCVNGDHRFPWPILGKEQPSAFDIFHALDRGEIFVAEVKHKYVHLSDTGYAQWLELWVSTDSPKPSD